LEGGKIPGEKGGSPSTKSPEGGRCQGSGGGGELLRLLSGRGILVLADWEENRRGKPKRKKLPLLLAGKWEAKKKRTEVCEKKKKGFLRSFLGGEGGKAGREGKEKGVTTRGGGKGGSSGGGKDSGNCILGGEKLFRRKRFSGKRGGRLCSFLEMVLGGNLEMERIFLSKKKEDAGGEKRRSLFQRIRKDRRKGGGPKAVRKRRGASRAQGFFFLEKW